MAFDGHKNFAFSTVSRAPSPATSGATLTVQAGDGAKFPSPPFNAVVWPANLPALASTGEIVRVTAISTDTLTIARIQEGTTARSIRVGDRISAAITAKTLTDIETQLGMITLGTDWTAGDNVSVRYSSPPDGLKVQIHHGTSASPNTVPQPTVKISRVEGVTRAALDAALPSTPGTDGPDALAALSVAASGTASTQVQATAISAQAETNSTYSGAGADAFPIVSVGRIYGSGTHVAGGGYFEGHWDTGSGATGKALGVEIRTRISTGVDGIYQSAGPSNAMGLWLNASGGANGAAAIQVGGIFNSYRVGLGFNASSVLDTTIRDDSTATISYDVHGARSAGGIAVRLRSGTGALIIGADALSTTTSQLLELHAGNATRDPILKITGGGDVSMRMIFNISTGNLNIGIAGGRDAFITGTVVGDGLVTTGAKTIHIGQGTGRATLRVSNNLAIGGGAADSFGGGAGVAFVANATTSPTTAPSNGWLYYSENGFPRIMDSLGSVVIPGDQTTSYSRTSDVSTLHPDLSQASLTLTSGTVYAATARCRKAGTYTKIRFATGSAGASVTDLRAAVWDSTGALLSQTADQSGSFAQGTLFDNVALGTPVTLTEGQVVFLGIGSVAGTAISVRGVPTNFSQSAILRLDTSLPRARTHAGLTAGAAVGNLTTSGSGNVVWVELIP